MSDDVSENDKKTFLMEVSREEVVEYQEYDGVNDVVSLEDAQ